MSCFTLNRAVSVLCSVLYADWYSSCSPFIVRCSVSRWTATFSNTADERYVGDWSVVFSRSLFIVSLFGSGFTTAVFSVLENIPCSKLLFSMATKLGMWICSVLLRSSVGQGSRLHVLEGYSLMMFLSSSSVVGSSRFSWHDSGCLPTSNSLSLISFSWICTLIPCIFSAK